MKRFKRSSWAARSVLRAFQNQKRKRHLRIQTVEALEDRTLLSVTVGMDDAHSPEEPQFVPGEILVGFEGDVATTFANRGAAAALQAAGRQVGGLGLNAPDVLFELPGTENRSARLVTLWQLPAGADVLQAVAQVSALPGIAYAEPNYIVSTAALPDDPKFDQLWSMDNTGQTGGVADADIDAPQAWEISTGSGNIVVGVIDTGVNYNHEDLAANIWVNPLECPGGVGTWVADGVDDDGNGFVDDFYGWDFANDDNDPMDDNKHGTHVAGTIGAVGNNGIGVTGVNWNVQIMALKFLNRQGSGSTAGAIQAINYATMMRDLGVNIVVTNNSWSTSGTFSLALRDAIELNGEANMLFIAAAGNSGGPVLFPARLHLDNIISVAATDDADALASFSSRGVAVDLGAPGAPGVDVLSTVRRNKHGTLSGTSMATPHVVGVAALAWDRLVGTVFDDYRVIRDAIFAGVDQLPSLSDPTTRGPATATGGRLNAHTTLVIAEALLDNATTISIADVSQLEGDAGTSDFVFTVSRAGDTSAQMTVDWATADGTATIADNEYNSSSGTLTFGTGVTSMTITVQVNGDTAEETHETFLVELTNLQGGTSPALIVDAQGLGTILNDDATVSISDATVTEGDNRVVFLDDFVPAGRGGLEILKSIAFGPDGGADGLPDHLFVLNRLFAETNVLRFDAQTGSGGEVFIPTGTNAMERPGNILFGPDGNLYVAGRALDAVFRFDGLTGAPLPAQGNDGAFFVTSGSGEVRGEITFGPDGNLYQSNGTTDEVFRYQGPAGASPGEFMNVFVAAGSGGLTGAGPLTFGPDGNLYVVSNVSDEALRYDGTTGAFINDFVSTGSGGLDSPSDLIFADGDLLVSSTATNEILLYNGTTGEFIEVYVAEAAGDMLFTSQGNLLILTDEVLRFGAASQAVFTISLSSPAGHRGRVHDRWHGYFWHRLHGHSRRFPKNGHLCSR